MSNRSGAQANLDQLVGRMNGNNNGQGFSPEDQWSLDNQFKVTQIQATLAVADAIDNAKPITTREIYGAMKRAEKETGRA